MARRLPYREIFDQLVSTYKIMASVGRYRPAAPNDGLGNITVPLEQLDLDAEAAEFAADWWQDEGGEMEFFIGCPDFSLRPAMVYALSAARLMCGGRLGTGYESALTLLRLAADELEAQINTDHERKILNAH